MISYRCVCPIHYHEGKSCNAISERVTLAPYDSKFKFKFYPYKPLIGGSIYVDIMITDCGYYNLDCNLEHGKFRVPLYGENSRRWARQRIIKDLKEKINLLFLY